MTSGLFTEKTTAHKVHGGLRQRHVPVQNPGYSRFKQAYSPPEALEINPARVAGAVIDITPDDVRRQPPVKSKVITVNMNAGVQKVIRGSQTIVLPLQDQGEVLQVG